MFTNYFCFTLLQTLLCCVVLCLLLSAWWSNIQSDFLVALSLCRTLILRHWKFSHGVLTKNISILKGLKDLRTIDKYMRGPHQNLGSFERSLRIFPYYIPMKYETTQLSQTISVGGCGTVKAQWFRLLKLVRKLVLTSDCWKHVNCA